MQVLKGLTHFAMIVKPFARIESSLYNSIDLGIL